MRPSRHWCFEVVSGAPTLSTLAQGIQTVLFPVAIVVFTQPFAGSSSVCKVLVDVAIPLDLWYDVWRNLDGNRSDGAMWRRSRES